MCDVVGGSGRNRTYVCGFGDRGPAPERQTHNITSISIKTAAGNMPPAVFREQNIMRLFRFLMNDVFTAPWTVLLQLQPGLDLFVARCPVINTVAVCALKFDKIVLRHRFVF